MSYPGRWWWLWGSIGLSFIVALVFLPLLALLAQVDLARLSEPLADPYLRRVIRFSLWQALLSTVLSIGLAVPLAAALSRRSRFPGRNLLLNLFSASLVIPTIVAVFGIVAVYGRNGWLNQLLVSADSGFQFQLYGLGGIVLAHVFFNLPLSTRIFLQSLDTIPDVHWRLSAQLGMSASARFFWLEWPAIRSQMAGLVLLVFSLCFTSFAIVMTLGGGPRATTIEVAIYQALRFDFDLGAAVSLALVQLLICSVLVGLSQLFQVNSSLRLSNLRRRPRYGQDFRWQRGLDTLLITFAFAFVVTPLVALFASAVNPAWLDIVFNVRTLHATLNTVVVGLVSGVLSVTVGCLLLLTVRHMRVRLRRGSVARLLESSGLVILVAPPVVVGTGLFLLLRPVVDVFSAALIIVILVNALMSLPFVLRVLSVPFQHNAERYDRLCLSLGLLGWQRWRVVEWHSLRRPTGLALALATTLSAGDLTVIALFGSERVTTLPLLLYQRMGSYRLDEASVTAVLLLLLCVVLFWLLERGVGGRRTTAFADQSAHNAGG